VTLPNIPYDGFSPVRLQGQPVRSRLPARVEVKPAPGILTSADSLLRPFARFCPSSFGLALCPVPGRAYAGRCTGGSRPPTLCGSASATRETFPTFPALLSPRPPTLRRWVRAALPLCWPRDTRLPRSTSESPPTRSVSASYIRRSYPFDAASFAFR